MLISICSLFISIQHYSGESLPLWKAPKVYGRYLLISQAKGQGESMYFFGGLILSVFFYCFKSTHFFRF